MDSQNPWREFPHDVYVKHMGHENVRQLEMLSRITGEQLELAANIQDSVIAILGITDGNGLCNIKQGQYKTVVGMDINAEYLDICRKRYDYLTELDLYQIDLMTEKDRAAGILKGADLVIANLLVKHIHLDNFMDIVGKLIKSIISVTIQYNPDGQPVSKSGFEAQFDEIQNHGQDCDESSLTSSMRDAGYDLIGREEYLLPNKKIFVRLDYENFKSKVICHEQYIK